MILTHSRYITYFKGLYRVIIIYIFKKILILKDRIASAMYFFSHKQVEIYYVYSIQI